MAEQGRCPQYWGDYDVQCVYHEGHEFPKRVARHIRKFVARGGMPS